MNTLIEKLKAARASSRELDAEVYISIKPTAYQRSREAMDRYAKTFETNKIRDCVLRDGAPEYTASIDAALALVEDVLPPIVGTKSSDGWRIGLERSRVAGSRGNWLWDAYVRKHAQDPIEGAHTSPAIAILIALLNAIQGEQG